MNWINGDFSQVCRSKLILLFMLRPRAVWYLQVQETTSVPIDKNRASVESALDMKFARRQERT